MKISATASIRYVPANISYSLRCAPPSIRCDPDGYPLAETAVRPVLTKTVNGISELITETPDDVKVTGWYIGASGEKMDFGGYDFDEGDPLTVPATCRRFGFDLHDGDGTVIASAELLFLSQGKQGLATEVWRLEVTPASVTLDKDNSAEIPFTFTAYRKSGAEETEIPQSEFNTEDLRIGYKLSNSGKTSLFAGDSISIDKETESVTFFLRKGLFSPGMMKSASATVPVTRNGEDGQKGDKGDPGEKGEDAELYTLEIEPSCYYCDIEGKIIPGPGEDEVSPVTVKLMVQKGSQMPRLVTEEELSGLGCFIRYQRRISSSSPEKPGKVFIKDYDSPEIGVTAPSDVDYAERMIFSLMKGTVPLIEKTIQVQPHLRKILAKFAIVTSDLQLAVDRITQLENNNGDIIRPTP